MNRSSTPSLWSPLAIGAVLGAAIAICAVAVVMMSAAGMWGMRGHMQNMHGGGRNTSNAPLTTGGAMASVEIRDFTYTPGNLQVPVGAKVTFTNYDSAPHTATDRGGGWDTGTLNKDDAATLTFDKSGDYDYYCKIHPDMKARLTVR